MLSSGSTHSSTRQNQNTCNRAGRRRGELHPALSHQLLIRAWESNRPVMPSSHSAEGIRSFGRHMPPASFLPRPSAITTTAGLVAHDEGKTMDLYGRSLSFRQDFTQVRIRTEVLPLGAWGVKKSPLMVLGMAA